MKFCVWFILFSEIIVGIFSEIHLTNFHIHSTCETEYGSPMSDTWRRSSVDCVRVCSEDPFCQSIFYVAGSNSCRLNTGVLSNFSQSCHQPQLYAEKDGGSSTSHPTTTTTTTTATTTAPGTFTTTSTTTGGSTTTSTTTGGSTTTSTTTGGSTTTSTTTGGSATTSTTTGGSTTTSTTTTPWTTTNNLPSSFQYLYYPYFFMDDPCLTTLDCNHTLNSQCTNSICMCNVGYKFDWTTHSCVSSCTAYGHSYQIEYGTVLLGFDNTASPNMSAVECLQSCTGTNAFTCVSADYDTANSTCYLSSETALTQPEALATNPTNNLYHRDCLFV